MAGLGAGRSSSSLVMRRTRQSRPASSKIASANSAHVQSPSAATCQTPWGSSSSSGVASARWPTYVGRASLVVDDRHLVLLLAEREHRPDEVLARPAEEPRRADDPALPHLALALELRPPVLRDRARLVRLDVRPALAAVEDVVGREVDDRSAERDDVSGALDVDARCALADRPRRRRRRSRPQRAGRGPAGSRAAAGSSRRTEPGRARPPPGRPRASAAPSCPPAPVIRTRLCPVPTGSAMSCSRGRRRAGRSREPRARPGRRGRTPRSRGRRRRGR